MQASADLFRSIEHDTVGLQWLLEHRPDQVRLFGDQAVQAGTGNDIYFAGDDRASGVAEALARLPRTVAIHAPAEWLGAINDAWEGKVNRLRCAEWRRTTGEPPPALGSNLALARPLTGALIAKLPETGLERLVQPYYGPEEFLRLSFGFAVVQHNKVISACTAFYVAGGIADLATETYPSLRNNGFGGSVLRATVAEALKRGLEPQVHSSICNGAVAHLTSKLGFDAPISYEVYARMA